MSQVGNRRWMPFAFMFCVLSTTVATPIAQSQQDAQEEYSWHGELVALDASARMVTLKSKVVGTDAVGDLARVKAADRVALTWSGMDRYADGIRRVVKQDGTKAPSEPFTFPVAFVAFDQANQYVTFRLPVPAASVEALKSVKPGEWVTATSRHRPAKDSDIVSAIRPYNSPAAASTQS